MCRLIDSNPGAILCSDLTYHIPFQTNIGELKHSINKWRRGLIVMDDVGLDHSLEKSKYEMGISRGSNKPKDLHALIVGGAANELLGCNAQKLHHGLSLNGIVCTVRLCAKMTQILFDCTECPHGVIEVEIGILGIGGSATLTAHGTKELLKTGAIKGGSKSVCQVGTEGIGLHISGFLDARNRLILKGHALGGSA